MPNALQKVTRSSHVKDISNRNDNGTLYITLVVVQTQVHAYYIFIAQTNGIITTVANFLVIMIMKVDV